MEEMSFPWMISGTLLFCVECYHVVTHACVLFRWRLLPEHDLRRLRWYFLFDPTGVFLTCFIYTQQMRLLATLHIIPHFYYVSTWNKTHQAIKMIRWSSLDWLKSKNHERWHWKIVLCVVFDTSAHIVCLYLLWSYVSYTQLAIAFIVVQVSLLLILFNSQLAWAAPGKEPDWVRKRLRQLPTY